MQLDSNDLGISVAPSAKEEPQPAPGPRRSIARALAGLAPDLHALGQKIPEFLPLETVTSREVARHIFTAGGKRIRPGLFMLTCQMLGYRGEHYFPMAAVCELVHTASLLHDDVVDSSSLRRGKPTANSIWGDETSVLVGDLIYARASEMMAATGNMGIVKSFARAIRLMSEGELLQLQSLYQPELSEEVYFQIVRHKTSELIAAACSSAGRLAGADDSLVSRLHDFGLSVGAAFQVVDDSIDYAATQGGAGKPTLADLPQGKITLPLILARETMTSQERQEMKDIVAKGVLTTEDLARVGAWVTSGRGVERALDHAKAMTQRALDILDTMPNHTAKDDLRAIVEELCQRSV